MTDKEKTSKVLIVLLIILFFMIAFGASTSYEPFRLWLDETIFQKMFNQYWIEPIEEK